MTGPTPPANGFVGLGFTGVVQAAQTPIANASVQVYAAGTTGNGSAPLALLPVPVLSGADGTFHIPSGSYICPSGTSMLFLVATGGQIGSGPANAAIALMTVPGTCGSLVGSPSFVVNELSTAASVYALRPFMAPGAQVGSTATNTGGLALAQGTLTNLLNLTLATSPGGGFPATGTAPESKLNTVANLLHACIASGGPGSAECLGLFTATSTASAVPANTLDAALSVAAHPGANIATLFALSTATRAFYPVLLTAPPDWTLPVAFTGGGMNGPAGVAIDAAGDVWVTNYYDVLSEFSNTGVPGYPNGFTGYGLHESFADAIDGSGNLWVTNRESAAGVNHGRGSVTLLSLSGTTVTGGQTFVGGGLVLPLGIALDRTGIAWIANNDNSAVTLLNSAGVSQAGPGGFTSPQLGQLGLPIAVAVDSKRNGWVADGSGGAVTEVAPDGSSFVSYTVGAELAGVAIDAADNVWTTGFYSNSVGLVSGGQVRSAGGFVGGGLDHPNGIAVDGAGTVWVSNLRGAGISELAGAGTANPGQALSPSAGWAPDAGLVEAYQVAIDAAGNVWVASYATNQLVEYVGLAAPVKTPLLGATQIP